MTVVSFSYLILLFFAVVLYYIFPKQHRFISLLISGTVFFVLSSSPVSILWLLLSILATHFSAVRITKLHSLQKKRAAALTLFAGLFVDLGSLALLKYTSFLPGSLIPLGISFYTLTAVGYLLEVYWEIEDAGKNILQTALFIGYFPQLTSGPITRYGEVKEQLFSPKTFRYENLCFGAQRILWGFFKKLVISARAGILVDAVYAAPEEHPGFYIWTAAALFMLQLYTDFSGCMDIILGTSECFGIILPENFRTPFFSVTVQEYWQRWHISLGSWLRDYILYPLLRSKAFRKLKKACKGKFGKKAAEQLTTYLAMLCVWLLIGLWHGGALKYVLGMGLWFFSCIVINQLLQPLYRKIADRLSIDVTSFGCHLFLSLKVFCLAAVGNMFFRLVSLKQTLHVIRLGFAKWNPWIFFDGSMPALGLTHADLNLLVFGTFLLFAAGILQEKYGSVRQLIAKQILPLRWMIWLFLFFFTLIYGVYGPGFEAAAFIYEKF